MTMMSFLSTSSPSSTAPHGPSPTHSVGSSTSHNAISPRSLSSPRNKTGVSPRTISSPFDRLSASNGGKPTGMMDRLYLLFLRHFKWLVATLMAIAFIRLVSNPPTDLQVGQHSTTSSSSSTNKQHNIQPSFRPDRSRRGNDFNSSSTHSDSSVEHVLSTIGDQDDNMYDASKESFAAEPLQEEIPKPIKTKVPTELKPYMASSSPVFGEYLEKGLNLSKVLVQIHLIVDMSTDDGTSPSSKTLMEAVERSKYCQLTAVTFIKSDPYIGTIQVHPRQRPNVGDATNNTSDGNKRTVLPLLYLVDFGSLDRDCHRLQLVFERIQKQKSGQTDYQPEYDEDAYFLLVDFSGSSRQTQCGFLWSRTSGGRDRDRVRLAKRSIVERRYFNFTSQTIHEGNISPNTWHSAKEGHLKPVLHSPFALREGFVSTLRNITRGEPIVNTPRTIDVGYFWKRGDYSHYGFYRRTMAELVKTLHHSKAGDNITMENQVKIAYSDEKGMEAGNIQYEYASQLLSCKIVVVTQRDEWEDHYRLFESLASGAMVMTDKMLAMPRGLADRENVVVYNDRDDLKELIRHYLRHESERQSIALEGYKMAMGRHRCWHRLEELLFGTQLTHVDVPFEKAPEKEPRPSDIYWLLAMDEGNSTSISVAEFV